MYIHIDGILVVFILDTNKYFRPHGVTVSSTLISAVTKVSAELDKIIETRWNPEQMDIEQFKNEQLAAIFRRLNLTADQIKEYASFMFTLTR